MQAGWGAREEGASHWWGLLQGGASLLGVSGQQRRHVQKRPQATLLKSLHPPGHVHLLLTPGEQAVLPATNALSLVSLPAFVCLPLCPAPSCPGPALPPGYFLSCRASFLPCWGGVRSHGAHCWNTTSPPQLQESPLRQPVAEMHQVWRGLQHGPAPGHRPQRHVSAQRHSRDCVLVSLCFSSPLPASWRLRVDDTVSPPAAPTNAL